MFIRVPNFVIVVLVQCFGFIINLNSGTWVLISYKIMLNVNVQ